jgi:hypothetical protein|tara:strand:+ start:357 stop:623 length:267 start_codon:yes stop_codon:yes gene_type:complete
MSPHKSSNVIKYCIVTSTTTIVFIFISLIPVTKKAFYWNQCFKKTYQWIDKNEMELKNWDKESKQSIAVAVCNGAVYEPKLKKSNLID